MKTKNRNAVAQKIALLELNQERVVASEAERVVALNVARVLKHAGKVSWTARSWKNSDGTFTIRAVKP